MTSRNNEDATIKKLKEEIKSLETEIKNLKENERKNYSLRIDAIRAIAGNDISAITNCKILAKEVWVLQDSVVLNNGFARTSELNSLTLTNEINKHRRLL